MQQLYSSSEFAGLRVLFVSVVSYKIHIGGYSGDIGDGFLAGTNQNINGMNFTTYDSDNNRYPLNCAGTKIQHGGGWWYNGCAYGEVNGAGKYFRWWWSSTEGIALQIGRMMVKQVDT